MFYVLPSGTEASSLETEDMHVFFKAYGDSTALANANRIEGSVFHGQTGQGVAGAAVSTPTKATSSSGSGSGYGRTITT